MRTIRLAALALLGAAAAAGCGGKKSSGCGSGGSGNLQVTVAGLPGGVPANISITGYAGVVVSSGTVAVTGGESLVVASTVAEDSTYVRKAYSAPAETVCVKNGKTAQVTVTYALVPSSNKLWSTTANGTEQLAAYGESALGATATTPPTVADNAGLTKGAGVAFDRDGNLWISDASVLKRYPAGSLGASSTVAPDVTISSAILTEAVPGPAALAFDGSGNLWVALNGDNKIARFTPDQIVADGAPTPAVVLGGTSSGLDGPAGLAFDTAGNLWVAHNAGVSRYDAASLTSSTVAPAATITAD
ncbi:MAG TPA: hypothetical protein VMV18_03190, partial [bacterium]|nr:hypothetical protein [bacterium]